MFCTKCGNQLPDGSQFCTKCGNQLGSAPAENAAEAVNETPVNEAPAGGEAGGFAYGSTQPQQAANPMAKPAQNNGLIIGIAAAAGVLLIGLIILLVVVFGKTKIDLTSEDLVEVSFTGVDGRGYATYEIDEDQWEEYEEKVLGKNPTSEEEILWYAFQWSIDYDIKKDSDLKNGDKVKLSVKWDEDSAEELGIKVKAEDVEYEVKGLEKATTIDVFDGIEVSYSGFDGNGSITWTNNSEDSFFYNVSYSADKYDGLSNGDVVTITAYVSESVLNDYNYVLKSETKEFTVEGLGEVEDIDVFSFLELDYSGTAPFASLSLRKTDGNEFVDYYVSFSADKTSDIKNGDVITVTAYVDDYYAESYGYTVSVTEKQYTVAGIDSYVTAYDEITETTLAEMDSQAKDAIDSWIVNQENWYSYQELKYGDPEHVADCFLVLKDGVSYDWSVSYDNAVYMCYKLKKTFKDGDKKKSEFTYVSVTFKDFVKYEDGTIYVDITSADVNSSTYATYADFFENEIRGKKVDYVTEEYKD